MRDANQFLAACAVTRVRSFHWCLCIQSAQQNLIHSAFKVHIRNCIEDCVMQQQLVMLLLQFQYTGTTWKYYTICNAAIEVHM